MRYVDVIIIGGGPAGISAAIWCKRLGIDALLLEKNAELGGQLINIQNEIIDYPGVYAGNGKQIQSIFFEHFQRVACPFLVNTNVLSVEPEAKMVKIEQAGMTEELNFRYLVIATGAGQRMLEVPGEKEMLARGEHYSATTDRSLFKGKVVAVVGGGDRAFEGACLLAETAATVYLIHRSDQFKAQKQFQDQVGAKHNIKVLKNTQVSAIHGEQCVTGIDLKSNEGQTFRKKVDAVFIRIGTKANTELFNGLLNLDDNGLIVTDHVGATSANDLYAIGDICTKPLYTSISSAAGQGATVAKHISSLLKQ